MVFFLVILIYKMLITTTGAIIMKIFLFIIASLIFSVFIIFIYASEYKSKRNIKELRAVFLSYPQRKQTSFEYCQITLKSTKRQKV